MIQEKILSLILGVLLGVILSRLVRLFHNKIFGFLHHYLNTAVLKWGGKKIIGRCVWWLFSNIQRFAP